MGGGGDTLAGMSCTVLPAVLHINKYLFAYVLCLFLKIIVFIFRFVLLRPRTSRQGLERNGGVREC